MCCSFSDQTKQERMHFRTASITRDMRYRLLLINYANRYWVSKAAVKYKPPGIMGNCNAAPPQIIMNGFMLLILFSPFMTFPDSSRSITSGTITCSYEISGLEIPTDCPEGIYSAWCNICLTLLHLLTDNSTHFSCKWYGIKV